MLFLQFGQLAGQLVAPFPEDLQAVDALLDERVGPVKLRFQLLPLRLDPFQLPQPFSQLRSALRISVSTSAKLAERL